MTYHKRHQFRDAGGKFKRKYTLDESFFSNVNTEEKAYWLGFLFADGGVWGNKISLNLQAQDRLHVVKFLAALGATYLPRERLAPAKPGWSERLQYGTTLSSAQMTKDLARYNIIPRKSLIAVPPTLPLDLQRHFWRGVIDGDGSISEIVKLCGSRETCEQFCVWIEKNEMPLPRFVPRGKIWIVAMRKGSTKKVLSLLYDHATIFLERKMEKQLQIRQQLEHWIPRPPRPEFKYKPRTKKEKLVYISHILPHATPFVTVDSPDSFVLSI